MSHSLARLRRGAAVAVAAGALTVPLTGAPAGAAQAGAPVAAATGSPILSSPSPSPSGPDAVRPLTPQA
ncbi:hypothetical protein ACFXOG_24295, partial [Streptomyces sp. NPDC059168]